MRTCFCFLLPASSQISSTLFPFAPLYSTLFYFTPYISSELLARSFVYLLNTLYCSGSSAWYSTYNPGHREGGKKKENIEREQIATVGPPLVIYDSTLQEQAYSLPLHTKYLLHGSFNIDSLSFLISPLPSLPFSSAGYD